jgi:hypothetical protein
VVDFIYSTQTLTDALDNKLYSNIEDLSAIESDVMDVMGIQAGDMADIDWDTTQHNTSTTLGLTD